MAERDLLTRALGLYMRMAGLAAPLDECLGTLSFWYVRRRFHVDAQNL